MRNLMKWAIATAMMSIGFAAFLVLCGEDIPGRPMSDGYFFGSKLAAGAVLYLDILTAKFFNRRGWRPEIKDPEADDGWED